MPSTMNRCTGGGFSIRSTSSRAASSSEPQMPEVSLPQTPRFMEELLQRSPLPRSSVSRTPSLTSSAPSPLINTQSRTSAYSAATFLR